jgi:glycosyltransferase involved in cell wall biosynthesis
MSRALRVDDHGLPRVLHVISGLDRRLGGPPIALAGLAAAQVGLGHKVTVLSTFRRGEEPSAVKELEQLAVPIHMIGPCRGPLARHPELTPTLEKLIQQNDIVHIHGTWEEVQYRAASIARHHDVPYIFLPQGMLDPWSLEQGKLKKRLYLSLRLRKALDRAAAIHCTSECERDGISRLNLRAPLLVEPLGLDLSEFTTLPEPGFLRTRWRSIGSRQIVLFLGRLHPKKGLQYLVPAMARLKHRDAVLVVAGPDSEGQRAEMEKLAHELGIASRVVFTGFLGGQDRIAAMVDADLFVLCSHQENFGIAVAESLAAGTPVIVSDQVHIHREIESHLLGGVVQVDIEQLAGEINRWLGDERLRAEAGARGRQFVFRHWDWMKIAARFTAHYQRMTTGSPPLRLVPAESIPTRRAAA